MTKNPNYHHPSTSSRGLSRPRQGTNTTVFQQESPRVEPLLEVFEANILRIKAHGYLKPGPWYKENLLSQAAIHIWNMACTLSIHKLLHMYMKIWFPVHFAYVHVQAVAYVHVAYVHT